MVKNKFSICVQAVIRVFDSFSYMPVRNGYIKILCDNNSKIISKDEGFFVVIGNEIPKRIRIKSTIYENIDVDILNPNPHIPINIWIQPKKGYNLVSNIKWITIFTKPYDKVYAFQYKKEPNIRLLENSKQNDEFLKIYQERKLNLDGATMLLYSNNDIDSFELINIKYVDGDSCILYEPLKKEHKKIKTGIYKIMCAKADEFGKCDIAISKDNENIDYIILNSYGEKIDEITI